MPEQKSCPVLVLAPHGRDAAVAASLLRESGNGSVICKDVAHLLSMLGEDIYCAVVTEEVLDDRDLRLFSSWVSAQPTWSDFPFIVLTRRGGTPDRNPAATRLLEILGNVTFLERPFHPTTFKSVIGTAVRGRRRQFEARLRLDRVRNFSSDLVTWADGKTQTLPERRV